MRDLPIHLLLFAIVGFAIVACSLVFSEPDDGKALKHLPRRLFWFFAGCGILAAILLFVEHVFASVD
jgi:cell division protein FtsW (lipid II flippase)